MKKYKKDINFNIFVNYKMLFSKMLSCVVVFFILINLINIRGIGVDVDFLNESVMVSKKMIVVQVGYMRAFSVKMITGKFVVGTNEGEGIIDKRARAGVEWIIALELEEIANRQGEGRGSNRGERTGEGNSLMASVGYLMTGDIYEKDRAIKEDKRWSDSFIGEIGIIKRGKEIEDEGYNIYGRTSLGIGEIIKNKERKMLIAEELSRIGLWNNNEIKREEGIRNNNKESKLSLLKKRDKLGYFCVQEEGRRGNERGKRKREKAKREVKEQWR